jgi:hypothetical protein
MTITVKTRGRISALDMAITVLERKVLERYPDRTDPLHVSGMRVTGISDEDRLELGASRATDSSAFHLEMIVVGNTASVSAWRLEEADGTVLASGISRPVLGR